MCRLQFANDTIFFSRASLEELQNLKLILLIFRCLLGPRINLDKSTLFGVNTNQGLNVQSLTLTYLGLPLGGIQKGTHFEIE